MFRQSLLKDIYTVKLGCLHETQQKHLSKGGRKRAERPLSHFHTAVQSWSGHECCFRKLDMIRHVIIWLIGWLTPNFGGRGSDPFHQSTKHLESILRLCGWWAHRTKTPQNKTALALTGWSQGLFNESLPVEIFRACPAGKRPHEDPEHIPSVLGPLLQQEQGEITMEKAVLLLCFYHKMTSEWMKMAAKMLFSPLSTYFTWIAADFLKIYDAH